MQICSTLLPRLRSLPLYHSCLQTAWPDLFVFFRRFVRQPKEIPPFSGQHQKYSKKFSENFQLRQEKIKRHACRIRRFVSGTLRAFCRLCRAKAEKIKQNRRTDQKKTKSQPQKREISGNAVRFRTAKRKSCLRAAPNLGRNLFAGLFSARPHALIGA